MKPDILLVEDDPVLRKTIADILKQERYVVTEADDGVTALAELQRCAPGLVLLDLMMPRMNGWELRQRMLKDPALAAVPVLVMTAHPSATNDQDYLQANGWLLKPIHYDYLIGLVAEHLPKEGMTSQ